MTRRRLNDQGTVYSRSDGRWEAAYFVTDPQGRRRRRRLYGRTRADAERRLSEAIALRERGLVSSNSDTVRTFLEAWIEGVQPTLRASTWERYSGVLRNHVLPVLGNRPLTRLGPQDLQVLYRDLLAKGLKPASVRYVHAVMHRALRQAWRWRILPANPADLVDPPRVPHREMAALDVQEVRALLAGARGEPLEAAFIVAATAGLRLGELLGLRWSSVDLDRGQLSVTAAAHRVGRELVFDEPKTVRSRRRVELTDLAVVAMRRRRAAQIQARLHAGELWCENGFVFTDALGRPLQSYVVRKAFLRVLRRVGLRPVRFHDLRHTAATLMLSGGIHPKIVSEMLGHSTVAITLDLYSHVTPTMQREAARAVDHMLR